MSDAKQIVGLVLDGAGGSTPCPWDGSSVLAPEGGAGTWFHLDRDDEAVKAWILEKSGIPAHVAAAMLHEDTRPRSTQEDEGLFVILRGVNLNPDAHLERMIAIRIWVTEQGVISLGRHPFRSIEEITDRLSHGTGPRNVSELLVQIITGLTRRLETIIDEITDAVADLEDRVIDPEKQATRHELAELRLRVTTLLRYLMPQQHAIAGILDTPPTYIKDSSLDALSESFQQLKRTNEDLAAARDRAAIIQDEIGNQLDVALNQRMYVLTLVAAITLPLTVITGLLGVNVGGIPGAASPGAFWSLTGGLALIVVVAYVLLRRWRWL